MKEFNNGCFPWAGVKRSERSEQRPRPAFLVGAGAIPAGLGIAGELGSFSVGFAILGGCFLAVSFLVGRLELPDKQ